MAKITGTNGPDDLHGTAKADVIDGRGGDDVLHGLGGNDELTGGTGDDKVYGDQGDDLLVNGAGSDLLDGGVGADSLRLHEPSFVDATHVYDSLSPDDADTVDTFARIETILGSEGGDHIEGGGAAHHLFGGGGNDVVYGGGGADEVGGGDGNDNLSGFGGDDVVVGGGGDDGIDGGDGIDRLDGQTGADSLEGGLGNDVIAGGLGDDDLSGGEGNDTLGGDDGRDSLFGGAGDDLLVGGRGTDFFRPEGGDDTIVLGSDAADSVKFFYDGPDTTDESIGSDIVRGFGDAKHTISIGAYADLPDGREAAIDTRDFLDSNDDGRIDAVDAEVARHGKDLVLDLDAVFDRAFGGGDFGTQQITFVGAGAGFATSRVEAIPVPVHGCETPICAYTAMGTWSS